VLEIALLRGGIARSDLWARCPDQPVIAVSTVDQVGSRLLFRGYGVSDSMRPIHAGLLGNDALYLLDEVHLSQPFRETLGAINERYRAWAEVRLPGPFSVVEMSATPGEPRDRTFRLDDDDRAHPLLSQRLESAKLTALASATGRQFASEVEKAVKPLIARAGTTVAVVVNRVALARELHERLSTSLPQVDVHLLTGRMRPLDRDALEKELFARIRAGRRRDPEQKPALIVATQCIEAGADFDFDGLVTECASLDALRQRFGRLDRLGEMRGEARGVVIARTDTLKDDPVYGDALGATWEWLNQEATTVDGLGAIDFGIGGLTVPDDAEAKGLLAPKPSAPTLLPRHLDAWAQTSPTPKPDPDVALWLHGPERGAADVQVVWRANLDRELLEQTTGAEDDTDGKGKQARDVAIGSVEALPPASGEAMSIPFVAVKRWLNGESEPDIFDVEGAREVAEDDRMKADEGAARRAVAWRGDASEIVDGEGLRPGDTIVVPIGYGGIASRGWAPDSGDDVEDLAEIACFRQRGRAVLRLHPKVVPLFGANLSAPAPAPLDAEDVDDSAAVLSWLEEASGVEQNPDRGKLLEFLLRESRARRVRIERLPLGTEPDSGEYFFITARRRVRFDGGEVTTEDDRSSFTGVKVPLTKHLAGVRDVAGEFADGVGLPAAVAADVRLAGRWHDVGKIDPRFQRLLHGGSEFKTLVEKEPLAKSAVVLNDRRARGRARERSRYPRGGRHELMSTALMLAADQALATAANDWELVLHLVASHHGRCRPLAPWVPDPEPVEMTWELDGTRIAGSSDHRLARLDSGVTERFWLLVRRYGWWGLAWLEAVLRLGDHRRSEEEQKEGAQQ
jgi:CRISPR-associated endonuclease/helicase Cas3